MNFFVIEGIDGCGKTTLIQSLQKFTKKLHIYEYFLFLKEPTDFETGKKIKDLMFSSHKISEKNWIYLFEEDRKVNIQMNILPNKNKIIVQDRYYFSTAAYQGKTKKEVLDILYSSYKKFPEPVMIFLDVNLEIAIERIKRRKTNHSDIFEKNIKQAYENYKIILQELKKLNINSYVLNPANRPNRLAKETLRIIFNHSLFSLSLIKQNIHRTLYFSM